MSDDEKTAGLDQLENMAVEPDSAYRERMAKVGQGTDRGKEYNPVIKTVVPGGGQEALIQAIITGIGEQYFKAPTGVREETATLPEGKATLWLPEAISKEGYSDLKVWLESILRRAARAAGVLKEETDQE